MVEPSELLENLGVVRVTIEDPTIRALCSLKFFLLLVHMTNLKPDVLLSKRSGRVSDDVFEALYQLDLT